MLQELAARKTAEGEGREGGRQQGRQLRVGEVPRELKFSIHNVMYIRTHAHVAYLTPIEAH